ncbi:50S ribosomal protein L18, partial [Alphaproteobacteria bacterium]|nr:50S ribosomal protein L18 [Alphaproteobacteria bacterium]
MDKTKALEARRKFRVRTRIHRRKNDRFRLSVFRSSKNIYAQVIDDSGGSTIVAASTLDKEIRNFVKSGANKDAAAAVGKLVAERAVSRGLGEVVFDRGAYLFHG